MEWGSVADWFGAVGTISAVIVALWQSMKKPSLKVSPIINKSEWNSKEVVYRVGFLNLSKNKFRARYTKVETIPEEIRRKGPMPIIKADEMSESMNTFLIYTNRINKAGIIEYDFFEYYTGQNFKLQVSLNQDSNVDRVAIEVVPRSRLIMKLSSIKNKLM